ncbi:MAG: SH3 domain-containing protein, partial [Balneolaceae bacterium]|nr:SH3 domain-containing protein [Balneolaceae bacterium]
LQPYAQITSVVTPLRSQPQQNSDNILAELVQGGQLQVVERLEDRWYRVLYGISENYISQNDAKIIWRSSDFVEQSEVVAVPRIPFGNIDVESNIPILSSENSNAYGILFVHENYQPPRETRSYAERDGRLIQSYLESALGLDSDHIYSYHGAGDTDEMTGRLQGLQRTANDSSYIFIYLAGYGDIQKTESGFNLSLLPAEGPENSIDLSDMFSEIAAIPSRKTIVLADIEFLADQTGLSESDIDLQQPLRNLSNLIISARDSAAVLFSAEPGQKSHLYVSGTGEDKKHHLFTYFFAKALQERNTNVGAIFQYLDRNVPYNSRRLHDEPQDPRLFGNTAMSIVPNR